MHVIKDTDKVATVSEEAAMQWRCTVRIYVYDVAINTKID